MFRVSEVKYQKQSPENVLLQKQPPEAIFKKSVLRYFAKFTGKHLRQRVFFNKVACVRPEACNLIKKGSLAKVFSCKFYEISLNIFFIEHLRTTASSVKKMFLR